MSESFEVAGLKAAIAAEKAEASAMGVAPSVESLEASLVLAEIAGEE